MEPTKQQEEDDSTISNHNSKKMMDIDLNMDNDNNYDEEPYKHLFDENTPETAEWLIAIITADNDEKNEMKKEEGNKQRSLSYTSLFF